LRGGWEEKFGIAPIFWQDEAEEASDVPAILSMVRPG
jgi:hypothetical protein